MAEGVVSGRSVAVGRIPAGLSGRFVAETRPERIRGNVAPMLIASVGFRVQAGLQASDLATHQVSFLPDDQLA